MPSFSGFQTQFTAKGRVVSDGEIFVTSGAAGAQTVPVIPSSYTAFKGVPVRTGTGIWKVTMLDTAFKVLFASVKVMSTTGAYLDAILQPVTLDSAGRPVINWTFCTVGTATPADVATATSFNVFVMYSEASIA